MYLMAIQFMFMLKAIDVGFALTAFSSAALFAMYAEVLNFFGLGFFVYLCAHKPHSIIFLIHIKRPYGFLFASSEIDLNCLFDLLTYNRNRMFLK